MVELDMVILDTNVDTNARGAALARRNTKDFEDCGIDVINPWGQ